jgi:hypothetical protein
MNLFPLVLCPLPLRLLSGRDLLLSSVDCLLATSYFRSCLISSPPIIPASAIRNVECGLSNARPIRRRKEAVNRGNSTIAD